MELTPRIHEDSILIQASPDEVYAVVSDVTRTGEWSPVCRACWWEEGQAPEGGGNPAVGAVFHGRNVTPERTWRTRSTVTAADPGRRFAWTVGEGYVNWSYDLQPADPEGTTTRLTEGWQFTEAGLRFFHDTWGDEAPARIEQRTTMAHDGIAATLLAIKRIVESA